MSQWEYEDEYDDSFDAYDGGNGADGMADAEGERANKRLSHAHAIELMHAIESL